MMHGPIDIRFTISHVEKLTVEMALPEDGADEC
jgi:hypothetical protein